MALKNEKKVRKPATAPTHKSKKSLRILRTSTGVLKRTSKFYGFVKSNVLTQSSNRVIQRLGEKRKGKRQKLREKVASNRAKIAEIKEKQPKNQQVEDEDEVQPIKRGFFDVAEELKLSAEDEKLLEQFKFTASTTTNKKKQKQNNLGEKIQEAFQEDLKVQEAKDYEKNYLSNPKVILVYSDLAELLKKYRSGKLPQPFHVIPTVMYWQDLLKLTNPHEWTPQAVFAATKIFGSSMDSEKAEYFFKDILLPAVRKNIQDDKKLNYHLYNALIKGLYKPQAWFKGILFELLSQSDVTLKEAQIIGSILQKHSVPTIHGSIVIYKLLSYPFSGPQAIILKAMIEKKYSLPQRVAVELVNYFMRFVDEDREMPVLWHQMFLRFCELYHAALTDQQKQDLKRVIQKKNHYLISPEILKVLSGDIKKKSEMEAEM